MVEFERVIAAERVPILSHSLMVEVAEVEFEVVVRIASSMRPMMLMKWEMAVESSVLA